MTPRELPRPDFRQTFAYVDLEAIRHNVRSMQAMLRKGTGLAAVVKADAYGHGSIEVGKAALEAGARLLAVAMAEEALPLRAAGIHAPILVIGPSNAAQLALGADLDLDLCVFTPRDLRMLQAAAIRTGRKVRIHLKADTGMNRIGLRSEAELTAFLDALDGCPDLVLAGMFTHFACADRYEDESCTMAQYACFSRLAEIVRSRGYRPYLHVSNSAAARHLPELDLDFIRFGISLYGYPPAQQPGLRAAELIPAMQVWAPISRIRTVAPGESVGYGAAYTAPDVRKIATVQIGYGDGLNRLLSGRGFMIAGSPLAPSRAPIVGRICMDMTMIDISGIEGIREGDLVMVMGRSGSLKMDADVMADLCGTISYEILLDYTSRLPRLYGGKNG